LDVKNFNVKMQLDRLDCFSEKWKKQTNNKKQTNKKNSILEKIQDFYL